MNRNIMDALFPGATENIAKGNCGFCGEPVGDKSDWNAGDHAEYEISGMCKKCQDAAFSESED